MAEQWEIAFISSDSVYAKVLFCVFLAMDIFELATGQRKKKE